MSSPENLGTLFGETGIMFKERIESLRKKLQDHDAQAMMILVAENRRYLSGFTGEDNGYDESAGALFISKEKLLLATDSRFTVQAEEEAQDFEIYCYKKGLGTELSDILSLMEIQSLGFEPERLSFKDHEKMKALLAEKLPEVELRPLSGLVEEIRAVKDEKEIETIRKSLHIAERALKDLLPVLGVGMEEKEAAWLLEQNLRNLGAEGLSFPTIVACGKNSAKPHAIPSKKASTEKTPILFDWGCKVNAYCSDITRTFFLREPDEIFMKIFGIVKKAQEEATQAIREGISGKKIDAIARSIIADAGFGEYFGHSLGHGVGLAIHEAPRLSPLQDAPLKTGMVVTVEPGIYLPEWGGIRLENMVVVREDGPEILNQTSVEEFLSS